jgi:hypothetical protein
MYQVLQSINQSMSQLTSIASQINTNLIQIGTRMVQAIGSLGTYIGPKGGGANRYNTEFQKSMNNLLAPLTVLNNTIPELTQTIKKTEITKNSNWDKLKTATGLGSEGSMLLGAIGGIKKSGVFGINNMEPKYPPKLAASNLIGGALKGAGTSFAKSFMPAISAMASLGPQMAFMAIVMAPIQAFLEGILEPLEPLNELMGAFGQILGTALIPTVQMMLEHLMPLIPGLMGVADAISPVVTWLFKFTTPLGLIFTLVDAITSISWPDVGKWFTDLPGSIAAGWNVFTGWITTQFNNIWTSIVDSFNYIGFAIGVAITKMVSDIVGYNVGGSDYNLFTSV